MLIYPQEARYWIFRSAEPRSIDLIEEEVTEQCKEFNSNAGRQESEV